jgi:hypothetical protein
LDLDAGNVRIENSATIPENPLPLYQAMRSVRSIVSCVFILLVFVSSTPFMVGIHFCSGKIQNLALFARAEGCEKEKNLPPCHRRENSSCCDDAAVVHEGEVFNASVSKSGVPPVSFVPIAFPAFILSDINRGNFNAKEKIFKYDTPLRTRDRTVAYQVFLI